VDSVERFAARVREERLRRGVSQERLADMAGLHRTYVSGLERAKVNATLGTAERVARALGMELVDLLGAPGAPGPAGEDAAGGGSDEHLGELPGRYAVVPGTAAAGMRLRITLETDGRGALRGSGRARFGDEVFPFRIDDVRVREGE
jgi:transcriptional regulator with XRE-family HTH domain